MKDLKCIAGLGLAAALVLCLTAGGQAIAEDDTPVPSIEEYLGSYATGDGPSLTEFEEMVASDPFDPARPASVFDGRDEPIVRVMPPSFEKNNIKLMDEADAPFTWPGRVFTIWGRVDGGVAPYQWEFDFDNNGTPDASGTATAADAHFIYATHSYATAGPKIAVLTVRDQNGAGTPVSRQIRIYVQPLSGDDWTLKVRRNAAITDGLRYLYLRQGSDGSWNPTDGYWSARRPAATASAVAAFELRRHYPTNSFNDDIYAESVLKGLEYIFSRLARYTISEQPYGNPDTNLDGYGIRCVDFVESYTHGLIMFALALSRTPDSYAVNGGTGVAGRSYDEILTNMVDMLAYSQRDSGSNRGGWRYNVNAANDAADNSAVQWAAIGLATAEKEQNWFKNPAPAYVKDLLGQYWLNYSRHSNGSYGYDSNSHQRISTTGSALFAEYYSGYNIDVNDPGNDPRILQSLNWLQAAWCGCDCVGRQFGASFYAIYATKKALFDMGIEFLPNGTDWYKDYVHFLVQGYSSPCCSNNHHQVISHSSPTPLTDGYWPRDCYVLNSYHGSTCWALLTLIPEVTSCQLYAVGTATPQGACPGTAIQFDGSGSYSTCEDHEVVQWLWDLDDSDGADIQSPDAVGMTVWNNDGYEIAPGQEADSVYATLWVIDEDLSGTLDPDTSSTRIRVIIDTQNHCPVACLNGPFTACVGDPIYLDACCSFDPDEGGGGCEPDSIVLYEWDFGGDGSVDFTSETCQPDTFLVFDNEMTMSVQLWVTDAHGCRSPDADADLIWSSFDDLHISADDIAFTPPIPDCEGEVTICGTVRASVAPGRPPIPQAKVSIFFDQVAPLNRICEQMVYNLEDGAEIQVCCEWTLPDSLEHEIIVWVDSDNEVQECVETDNLASRGLTCGCTSGPSLLLPLVWDLEWEEDDGGFVRWHLGADGQFDVYDVDQSSLLLNGTVPAAAAAVLPSMEGFTGPVLVARFPRFEAVHSFADQEPGPKTAYLEGVFVSDPDQCLKASADVLVIGPGYNISEVEEDLPAGPSVFAIEAIRPNPTSGATEIQFYLPGSGEVGLSVYDAQGRRIKTLVEGSMSSGRHSVSWNRDSNSGQPVSSGIYFIYGRFGEESTRKRVVVLQ